MVLAMKTLKIKKVIGCAVIIVALGYLAYSNLLTDYIARTRADPQFEDNFQGMIIRQILPLLGAALLTAVGCIIFLSVKAGFISVIILGLFYAATYENWYAVLFKEMSFWELFPGFVMLMSMVAYPVIVALMPSLVLLLVTALIKMHRRGELGL